jgi:hypothetical protein
VGATTVGVLSGLDGTDASLSGRSHPVLNALRLRQDLSGQNSLGLVYTDRVDGSSFNRVAALDGRAVLGGAWNLSLQGGASATRDSAQSPVRWGPIWRAALVRSGRRFGLTLSSYGVGDDFRASSGFITRPGVVQNAVIPSYTIVGAPGSWLESVTSNVFLAGTWDQYRHFSAGNAPDDRQADFSEGLTLRGGWQLGAGESVESFGYPSQLYANYWIERVRAGSGGAPPVVDTIPFTGQPHIPNLDLGLNLQTPQFQRFSLSAFVLWGHDENFYEWASARILLSTVDLAWRPTGQLRTELIYNHQHVIRRDDGSTVALIRVPRLKVEYQLSRSIFLRLVGQYTSSHVDSLRDDSRTGGTILIRDPATGTFTRSAPAVSDGFRVDWLFSYRPTPGTVVFAGYGSSFDDTGAFQFRSLTRTTDGFFVKISYLLRA